MVDSDWLLVLEMELVLLRVSAEVVVGWATVAVIFSGGGMFGLAALLAGAGPSKPFGGAMVGDLTASKLSLLLRRDALELWVEGDR